MPSNRSATEKIVDRLQELIEKVIGPVAAPAKPAPVPVPVSPRRPHLSQRRPSRI